MHTKNGIYLVLLTVLIIGAMLSVSNPAAADVKYGSGRYAGKQTCHARYPANHRYNRASKNLIKGGCWSCPRGFKRTANPLPDKHKSCHKPRPYTDARYAGKATGILHNICKGSPWLKDKKCWTCPAEFKRSNKKIHGKVQCKPREKYYYHPAVRRGNSGCPEGAWSPLVSGNCYSCPAGYFRNPTRVSLNRARDKKACMTFVKSKKEKASFIKQHLDTTRHLLKKNEDLIMLAGDFVKNLQRIRKQRGHTGSFSNVTKADIRDAGGTKLLMASCGRGFPSISITAGGDGSYIVGVNGSGGIAFGLEAECGDNNDGNDWIDRNTDFGIATLGTVNGSIGASAGGDASVNVGFWKSQFNKLYGFAQGVVLGGSYAEVGMNGSAWWAINWGAKDEFAGISVGYQGGLSAEAEYNWGYTFQKH